MTSQTRQDQRSRRVRGRIRPTKPPMPARIAAVLAALALFLTGCGGSGDEDKTITLGVVPSWTADLATIHVYRNILEKNGYTVEIKEFSDLAPVYAGIAEGDLDVMSAEPERTQKDYWDEYGDRMEDFGAYYDDARLFLAVPDYVADVQSVDDLAGRQDEFGGKVIGIEAGAGISELTKNEVFPAYGLDDGYELVLSSTTAMLAELKKSIDAQEPIVVTLWTPYWASQVMPLRRLEDPKGAYGDPEGVHTLAREGFSDDFPEVAEMMKDFTFDDKEFGTLMDAMANEYGPGKEQEAVQAWLDENPDFASNLEKHLND